MRLAYVIRLTYVIRLNPRLNVQSTAGLTDCLAASSLAMRTTWPATGSAFSVGQRLAGPFDTVVSRLCFLGGSDPADPLVAS